MRPVLVVKSNPVTDDSIGMLQIDGEDYRRYDSVKFMRVWMKVSKLVVLLFGFLYFLSLLLTRGAYYGPHIFYRDAQEKLGIRGRIANGFLTLPTLRQMFQNIAIFERDYYSPRLSPEIIRQYSSSSLRGYGDKHYAKGGGSIHEQQRGLILPFMAQYLGAIGQKHIVEIGTGNGDVLNYVYTTYPQHRFTGIDFNLQNAIDSYPVGIEWIEGYALDELTSINPELIFCSSTMVLFTPGELNSYLRLLRSLRCTDIFISEPMWGPSYRLNNQRIESFHLEEAVWLHNFPAYFLSNNFSLVSKQIFHYTHPRSGRPDISIFNGHFKLESNPRI